MKERTSVVQNVEVDSVILSSIFQVGDNQEVKPRAKAIAVQRQIPLFLGDEGSFSDPIFLRPKRLPVVDEPIRMSRINLSPYIQVGSLRIRSVSVAGVVQTGNSRTIETEARVKHFRQLVAVPGPDSGHFPSR